MPSARQLCGASNRVSPPGYTKLPACPVCSRKLTITEYTHQRSQGETLKLAVIPPHPRDEYGEIKTGVTRDKYRYPGSGSDR